MDTLQPFRIEYIHIYIYISFFFYFFFQGLCAQNVICATSKYQGANNYFFVSESHGISLYVDQLLIQLTVFQCILKGQAEGDDEGEKDQQARSSQREQVDPEMDQDQGSGRSS